MVRATLLCVLILGVGLAGCTEPPPEMEEEVLQLPRLAEYAGCPWLYPDNSSHDCESTDTVLEAGMEPPVGWVCTAENRDLGWSLHWNPADDAHGLWYELPENATGHTGVFFLRTDFQEHLYRWDEAPTSGFLRLPPTFGDNVTFRYQLHDFGYATNGTLDGAEGTPLWSLHMTRFWVVHKFETDNATYTFQNMTDNSVVVLNEEGEERVDPYFEVNPFEVTGEDFALRVHHERSHGATSQGLISDVRLVDRFCETGLGS